jgi:thiol-disulfide isomerase/thioredoxin
VAALDPGDLLPPIDLFEDHGGRATLPGSESLYAFFKTTCPTCELAWPVLERIRRLGEGGPLALLAVSQDDPGATADFNRRLGVRLRTLFDPPPWRASDALGLANVPTLLLVGTDGRVRDSLVGFHKRKVEELARYAAVGAAQPYQGLFRSDEDVPEVKPG